MTNDRFGTRSLAVFGLFVFTSLTWPLQAQVEDFITGDQLNYMTLHEGNLFWKSDSTQAGMSINRIRRRPVEGSYTYNSYNPFSCNNSSAVYSELALDETYVYWISGDGGLRRMVSDGSSLPTTITNVISPLSISPNGKLAVSGNYIFWTEEQGEFRDRSAIFRAEKTPGSSPSSVISYATENNALVTDMVALSDSRLIYLLSDGRLLEAQRVGMGTPPLILFIWQETATVSVDATAMRIIEDRLWWADQSSDGRSTFFRSAPLTDLSNVAIHHLAFLSSSHEVKEFVADGANLFYQDLTTSSSGPLMRKSLLDSSAAVEIASLLYPLEDMEMTERHVLWRKGLSVISRLPVNAAAVTRDLVATGLEVLQVIQNSNSENPLVMGKPTFVRLFGQISSSSVGETRLDFWPGAYLYGEVAGIRLPGSPLTPYKTAPLMNTPSFRTTVNHGFWFRLPDSWTRRGEVRLRGVINPSRIVSETIFINNSRIHDADFIRQASITMVMKPTRTTRGTIYNYSPEMQPMFDYIEALLPVSKLRIVWGGGLIEEPYDPFHWVGDGGPFEVTDEDDDGAAMLTELNTRKVFTYRRYSEPVSGYGFDHYVAMLKPQRSQAWNGLGRKGNDGIGLTVAPTAFFKRLQTNTLGVPLGAATECQELGHNYGRQHVNCGNPDNVDTGYPYATNTLYSPGIDYIGFNPFKRQLILPADGRDYMSYCGPKWTSDYTWRALVNLIGDIPPGIVVPSLAEPASLAGATPSPPTGSSLIMGFIDIHDNRAAFKQILPLSGPVELAAAQAMIGAMPASASYQISAFKGDDVGANYPVYHSKVPTDEGAEENILFITIGDIPSSTERIEFIDLANGNISIGLIMGGGGAPTVSVHTPAAGTTLPRSNPFLIGWTGNDPDNHLLVYTVRFSPDGGTTWQVVASGTPAEQISMETIGLSGSTNCLIEVIASDGILTGTAQSGVFSLEKATPKAYAFIETPRGKECNNFGRIFVHSGETLIFHGVAFDDEDGEIAGETMNWNVNGPLSRSGSGRQFLVDDLPPGDYTVGLLANDSDKNSGTAELLLTVDPHFVEDALGAIKVDGHPDDAGYLRDRHPLTIQYDSGESALVRMVHYNGNLYVCASGLREGTDMEPRFGVMVDLDRSGGLVPGVGDLKFEVFADGRFRTLTGNGSSYVIDAAVNGLSAGIYANAGYWSVELCIDADRLGGWNGQTIHLSMVHDHIDLIDETNRNWPVHSFWTNPSTYGAVVMGPDPNDDTDLDMDGLPDRYELEVFGEIKPTAEDDTDGDGESNGNEMESGTDPADPNSVFRIGIIYGQQGNFLYWSPQPERSYNILSSQDLFGWETIAFNVEDGQWSFPLDQGDVFYKVEVCRGR